MVHITELELKLRLIDYQENLIRNSGESSEEFIVPLSADQLIEVLSHVICYWLSFYVIV